MSRLALIIMIGLALHGVSCQRSSERSEQAKPSTVVAKSETPVDLKAPREKSTSESQSQQEKPPPPKHDSEACADCHPDIVEGFKKTGMGNSLYRPNDRPQIEDFTPDKATIQHPKSGLTYRAYVGEEGRWWQEESLSGTDYRRRVEAKYVIGSGNHTRSYLGEVDGEIVELPLTWYTDRKIWDMSPGYEVENHFRFDRPAKPICLFCHNNLTPAIPHRASAYQGDLAEGISCNRCHGDGAAHVESRSNGVTPPAGAADPTILNPRRLPLTRQLQICQQCHLSGVARLLKPGRSWDQYDPRTPLNEHMSIYTYASDDGPDFSITSHGYRLSLSACFKESKNTLTCTRCHDPHRRDKVKETKGACLSCHQLEDCGDAHSAKGDQTCSSCHMHRGDTSDIPHVSFTDHFIRKRPSQRLKKGPKKGTDLVDVFAHLEPKDPPAVTRARLGVAHARIWRLDGKSEHKAVAKKMLQSTINELPTHAEAWQELALILKADGQPKEAAMAFAHAAIQSKGHHRYRTDEAENYEQLGNFPAAAEVLSKSLEVDPNNRVAWGNLANTLLRLGRLDDAERAYARAEQLAPSVALTASNRGYLMLQQGKLDQAERWFKEALRRDGSKAMMYANLGTLALARRDGETARKFYLKAIKRNPKFGVGYWMLARLDSEAGRFDTARGHLVKMVEVSPKDIRGYLDLAALYRKEGDTRQAMVILIQAQKMFPQHPGVADALRRIKGN
jgi:Flp pilus assembly protein TadD